MVTHMPPHRCSDLRYGHVLTHPFPTTRVTVNGVKGERRDAPFLVTYPSIPSYVDGASRPLVPTCHVPDRRMEGRGTVMRVTYMMEA